jgi:hypothetical protein
MQRHFSGFVIPIPFVGLDAGYFPTYVVCYIGARILFSKIRHRLPYFRGVHAMLSGGMKPKSNLPERIPFFASWTFGF